MDNLKDMKACVHNDFARYKRAWQSNPREVVGPEAQQAVFELTHTLQMFLTGELKHPKQYIVFKLRRWSFDTPSPLSHPTHAQSQKTCSYPFLFFQIAR